MEKLFIALIFISLLFVGIIINVKLRNKKKSSGKPSKELSVEWWNPWEKFLFKVIKVVPKSKYTTLDRAFDNVYSKYDDTRKELESLRSLIKEKNLNLDNNENSKN